MSGGYQGAWRSRQSLRRENLLLANEVPIFCELCNYINAIVSLWQYACTIVHPLPKQPLPSGKSLKRSACCPFHQSHFHPNRVCKQSTMSMPISKKPKLGLLSLPPELLLQIASYHLEDFLFWQSNQCRYLSKYLKKQDLYLWPYIALSKAHPYLYSLLITQRLEKQPPANRTNFDFCGLYD